MELDRELLNEFAEITYDKTPKATEITCYGTAVVNGAEEYVRLDGSDELTPTSFTVRVHHGDRVLVLLKNHTATVIGNITTPSMTLGYLNVTDGIIVGGYLTTNEARTSFDDQTTPGLTFSNGGIGAYGGSSKYWFVTNSGDLYANSAEIEGKITANSGYLGSKTSGFIIDETGIYSGTKSGTANGNITLSNQNFTRVIDGTGLTDLRLAIGSRFGVTEGGKLYATDAVVSGSITLGEGVTIPTSKISGLDIFIAADGKPHGTPTQGSTGIKVSTDGLLTASNAVIWGDLYASGGSIGGFTIDSNSIHTTNVVITSNATNSVGLSSSTFKRTIGDTERSNLKFAIGSGFGVNNAGVLYASGAIISGNITATTGEIAGWKILSDNLRKEYVLSGATYRVQVGGNSSSSGNTAFLLRHSTDSFATFTNDFYVTFGGKLYSNNAEIKGAITATSGTIGANATNKITIGTNATNASIYYGMSTLGNTSSNGFYIGTDGIALGKGVFKVTSAGALTATSATIEGKVTAASGKIANWTIETNAITNSYTSGNTTYKLYLRGYYDGAPIGNGSIFLSVTSGGTTTYPFSLSYGGTLKATNAIITGQITATSGTIGANATNKITIGTNATNASIYYGMSTLGNTSSNGFYIGTDGIALGKGVFKVTSAGALTATSATVKGAITATSGTIGANATNKITIGTNATNASIYYGMSTLANTSSNGFYIGTDGIALGKGVFKVTSAGALTATSATVKGAITATSGKLGNWTISTDGIEQDPHVRINSKEIYLSSDLSTDTNSIYINAKSGRQVMSFLGTTNKYFIGWLGKITDVGGDTETAGYTRTNKWGIGCTDDIYIISWAGGVRLTSTSSSDSYSVVLSGNAFRPGANATSSVAGLNLGTSSYRWEQVYAKNSTISTSDGKNKMLLGDIDYAKELIMSLHPQQYMWKDGDHRRTRMGFVAQDIADICKSLNKNLALVTASYKPDPELGEEDPILLKDYFGEEVDDEKLTWGLSYHELIAPLVTVVQQQQKEIENLKEEISALKKGAA